jgi:hypothetical protein
LAIYLNTTNNKLTSLKIFLWLIFLVINILLITLQVPVYGELNATVTPNCGPIEGFNIVLETGGFLPNSNVHWDLISVEDNSTGLSGYFYTNGTGGFEEPTFADDLPPGKYIINFFDDINNDEKVDSGRAVIFTNLSIPCVK